ncbi:MAG: hypothetical protein WEB90_04900 [Gemmatimonadota bacterium]
MSGTIVRRHFWLPTSGGALAATLHTHSSKRARPHGVLICPPFGYEYTHAHRSLLHLGDALASVGITALRIDYLGTGDSEGDAYTPDLFERWIAGVVESSQLLSEMLGGALPTLVGVRFGALLAGLAAERAEVQNLVSWHPVSSGKRYLREHQALQRVAGDSRPADESAPPPNHLEAGGFVLARATMEALERADLRASRLRIAGEALVLDRDDLGPEGRLAEHLQGQETPTEVVAVPGYLGMMAEPQYTVVPEEAIGRIVRWIDARVAQEPSWKLSLGRFAEITSAVEATWNEAPVRVTETHTSTPCPGGRLVGVLAEPALGPGQPRRKGPVVLLTNSGSVHHVGPNRLYVDLARDLARAGIASLRLDLRNLGDSRVGSPADENHPYPATAVEDVALAIDELGRFGFDHVVVAGLCSGAHTAFHAGLELVSSTITGVICINTLTFQWEKGMSLDTPDSHRTTRDAQYYSGAVRNWAKWKRLLTGKANLGYITRFAAHRARDVVGLRLRNGAERLRVRPPGPLGQRLEQFKAAGRPLHLVFSSNDPGYAILMSEAGPTVRRLLDKGAIGIDVVDGADHTFSKEAWRARAAVAVVASVRSMSGAPVPTA